MSGGLALLLTGGAGAAAGVAFFAGLHWTVGHALVSGRPVRWLLASFLARLALVGALLGGASQGHWERIVVALAGIVLARTLVLARVNRLALAARASGAKE